MCFYKRLKTVDVVFSHVSNLWNRLPLILGFSAIALHEGDNGIWCSQTAILFPKCSHIGIQHFCLNALAVKFPACVAEQGSSPVAFPPLRTLGKVECRLEKFLVYSIDRVLLF